MDQQLLNALLEAFGEKKWFNARDAQDHLQVKTTRQRMYHRLADLSFLMDQDQHRLILQSRRTWGYRFWPRNENE